MANEAKRITCPLCKKELDRVGYTTHGTKILIEVEAPQHQKDACWEESDDGADCTFYCLECNHEFDPEDLEEARII